MGLDKKIEVLVIAVYEQQQVCYTTSTTVYKDVAEK
jgi:hypothetical protein